MKKNNAYYFPDYPNFRPNLSPRKMFKMGSFGGTYWRPIKSTKFKVNKKTKLNNRHKLLPKSYWKSIEVNYLTSIKYKKNINTHKVKVGTSLEVWENKD